MLWIVVTALGFLGFLAWLISRMPEAPIAKKKKEKRVPPPEPQKDWQALIDKAERKAHALEGKLREQDAIIREKDKELTEQKSIIDGLGLQFSQEQAWRKREEEAVAKEKKREEILSAELTKARDELNTLSTLKIKLDYEVREWRTQKESLSTDVRRLNALNLDLERKLKAFSDENRALKVENNRLQQKKEADQWVAKDDFLKLEKVLKRVRWELEQFKRQIPKDSWPQALQPKPSVDREPQPGNSPSESITPPAIGNSVAPHSDGETRLDNPTEKINS